MAFSSAIPFAENRPLLCIDTFGALSNGPAYSKKALPSMRPTLRIKDSGEAKQVGLFRRKLCADYRYSKRMLSGTGASPRGPIFMDSGFTSPGKL